MAVAYPAPVAAAEKDEGVDAETPAAMADTPRDVKDQVPMQPA